MEALLEDFLRREGVGVEQFFATCKECLDRSRAEGRWNKDAMFVQVLTASCEFEEFVGLMKSTRFLVFD